jgi:paraquat-inducible protein B
MSKKSNPAVVGSFVLGAIVLSIVGVMLLGGGAFMQERMQAIVYFDESISGLDVGAPVEFEGVRIGTVTSVRMEMNTAEDAGRIFRPVIFQIEFQRIHFQGGRMSRGREVYAKMENLVQVQGIRARLATQSVLTGRSKIVLIYSPETPINRKNRDSGIWEMPSIPSPLIAMRKELQELPLSEIVMETHRAITQVANLLDPETSGQTLAKLNNTLTEINEILAQVKSNLDPLANESVGTLRDIRTAVRELQTVLERVDTNIQPMILSVTDTTRTIGSALAPESPMRGEVSRLMGDIRETSRAIRLLMEHLEQHPESIVWGK